MKDLELENKEYLVLKIIITILIIIGLLLFGAVVFHNLEGLSYIDALYLSTSTLTTVGYGDITPTTNVSKLFAIGYMLLGISITFYALWIIAQYVFNKQEAWVERRILNTFYKARYKKLSENEKKKVSKKSKRK